MNEYTLNHDLSFDNQVMMLTNRVIFDMNTGETTEENLHKKVEAASEEIFCRGACSCEEVRRLYL